MIYPDCDMKKWEYCDNSVILANANYYYTKQEVDEIVDDVEGMDEEEVQRMINRSIRTKADKTDVIALSGQVQDNADAILNTYTKAETNALFTPYSTTAQMNDAIDSATSRKADSSALTAVDDALTAHTADTSVHVTSQEKTYWNNKLDASAYTPTDLSNYYTKGQTDDLLDDKLDVTAYTPTDLSNYYTKGETDGVVNGAVSGKADTSAVTESINAAVSGKADTTYVNQIASQATDAITALTQTVSNNYNELTGQTSDLYVYKFGDVRYDSATHRINFYAHGNSQDVLAYVDATAFIKDGMVSNVEIVNGNLVITFNSDAGKQPISIPLTDIFNPANYYTTAQTQSYVSGFTYDKATIDQKVASGGTFDPDLYYDKTATDALLAAKADTASTYTKTEVDTALGNKADASALTAVANDVQTVSGQVQTKVSTSDFNTYTAATASAIDGKADTSAVTAVSDALTAHTANTSVHVTSAEKTTWNNKSDFSGDYNDLTNKPTIPTVPTNVSDFTNDAGYITNADIAGKADTSAVTQVSDALTAHTANTSVHVTSAEKAEWNDKAEVIELTQAQYDALVTKDPDVLYVISDATAADISNYWTSAQTQSAITKAVSGKVDTSAITTTITSGSTDSEIPTAKAVYNATQGGGGGVTVDPTLDSGSTNPVANSAITNAINAKQDKLQNYTYILTNVSRYDSTGKAFSFEKKNIPDGSTFNSKIDMASINGNGIVGVTTDFQLVETSAITSAMTSSSTDAQVPSAKAVYDTLGGLKLVSLTQSEYDQLATKDANTLYIINNVVS